MQTKKVVVLPYDNQWKADFEVIKAEIEAALEGYILRVEHVGSTAVEGLSAKPCIDIDVVVESFSVLDTVVGKLASVGYIHEGNLGINGREAFKYTNKPHLKTHHLYVCDKDSVELRRHVTFRNFLRNHPDAVKEYSAVKEKAAQLFPNDIEGYMAHKATCIENFYRACGLME